MAQSVRRGVRLTAGADLAVDMRYVPLDRPHADHELISQFAVAPAASDQAKDFYLAICEAIGGVRSSLERAGVRQQACSFRFQTIEPGLAGAETLINGSCQAQLLVHEALADSPPYGFGAGVCPQFVSLGLVPRQR